MPQDADQIFERRRFHAHSSLQRLLSLHEEVVFLLEGSTVGGGNSRSCTEEKDVECLKRHLSRTYARDYAPARALKKMREDAVPLEHRPSTVQIKNKRPKQATRDAESGITCLGDLRRLVSSPVQACIFIQNILLVRLSVR